MTASYFSGYFNVHKGGQKNMKEQIRCAVLGLGRLGYWHAENLALKVKGAQLVRVADPNVIHAEKVPR